MTAQILALIIFLAMFVLIILEVWDRHLITPTCKKSSIYSPQSIP